jgi:hypothetical protein
MKKGDEIFFDYKHDHTNAPVPEWLQEHNNVAERKAAAQSQRAVSKSGQSQRAVSKSGQNRAESKTAGSTHAPKPSVPSASPSPTAADAVLNLMSLKTIDSSPM